MSNFRRKGRVLQKFSEVARATRKVHDNITFDPGTQLEKKLDFH